MRLSTGPRGKISSRSGLLLLPASIGVYQFVSESRGAGHYVIADAQRSKARHRAALADPEQHATHTHHTHHTHIHAYTRYYTHQQHVRSWKSPFRSNRLANRVATLIRATHSFTALHISCNPSPPIVPVHPSHHNDHHDHNDHERPRHSGLLK